MVPLTVAAASSTEPNAQQHRRDRRRVGHESHRDPGRDAHRPFGADEAAPQVEAGRVRLEPTEPGRLAVREHDVDGEHVRARDARGQAVRPAGVGGDVPADRAGLLGGRIGCVVQAQVVHGAGEVEVQHTGLDPRDPAHRIDLEHPVQLGGDDHDRVTEGVAPPARPVPLPRATKGRPWRRATRTAAATALGRLRPAHRERVRPPRLPRRRVQGELERFGARTFRADRVAKIVEKMSRSSRSHRRSSKASPFAVRFAS